MFVTVSALFFALYLAELGVVQWWWWIAALGADIVIRFFVDMIIEARK